MNNHAGKLTHRVGSAFDVLDVERGEDIDPEIQQLQYVLITFGMTRARRVGVSQFIDQHELGDEGR